MMPCSNMVLWVDARKKGSGEPIRKIKKWHSWWFTYGGNEVPEGMVPCTGRVKIEVETHYGNGCCDAGGTSIVYECDTCKGNFYPEMPQDAEDLAELLNEGTISKTKGKARAKAHIAAHEAHQERMNKYMAESKIKFAANRAKAAEDRKLRAEGKAARKKAAAAKKKAAKKA